MLVLVVAAWAITLARYLRHRVLLSFDTVNNYAHVWYVADRIWQHRQLPLRMPILGHGQALAFPYGFLPWTTAALVHPLLGDWTVTLWMALGAVGMAAATFFAFPELRRGWWAATVLLNPAIVQAALFGQLSFSWAATLLLCGIGAWRRRRPIAAVVLVGLAQATHPAVVLPLTAVIVLAWLPFEGRRRFLVGCYAVAVVIAAPAIVLSLVSPVFGDATIRDVVVNFFATIAPRSLAVLVPVAATLAIRGVRWRGAGAAAVGLAFLCNVALQGPMRVANGWRSLARYDRSNSMRGFLRSSDFVPGRTYRVLRNGDAKLGLYLLLQAGGRLDSEFFPEGMAIRSFRRIGDYERLLCERKVDYVVDFASYDQGRRTNEHQLLTSITQGGGWRTRATLTRSSPGLDVFAVTRDRCDRQD